MTEAESRHLSVRIARPAAQVYAYAHDPSHLPEWAAGLSSGIELVDEQWVTESPMGRVTVAFVADNEYGVLDHVVALPSGETVLNPLRVLVVDDATSEVLFTVRRRPGMSEAEFEGDCGRVAADLETLRGVLER